MECYIRAEGCCYGCEQIAEAVNLLLEGIGEDRNREGLIETPDRRARMYSEIFTGIGADVKDPPGKDFKTCNNGMFVENY